MNYRLFLVDEAMAFLLEIKKPRGKGFSPCWRKYGIIRLITRNTPFTTQEAAGLMAEFLDGSLSSGGKTSMTAT
jgi:hypothetical protein